MSGRVSSLVALSLTTLLILQQAGVAQEERSFVAHVATADKREDALASAEKIRRLLREGQDIFIHEVTLPSQGTSFRLRIGPLMSAADAASVCREVLGSGHGYCKPENAFQLAGVQPGFYGELLLRPLPDGRNMQVAQSFGFVDSQARKWEVPVGAVTDGASIPQAFWSIIGSPFSGKYRLAAVIHDHFCATKHRKWKDTHDAFYETMLASGEGKKKALLMWAAVYRFGPRWLQSESVCWGTCAGESVYVESMEIRPTYSEREFLKIKAEVEKSQDVSLEELRKFVDEQTFEFAEARVRGIISGGGADEKSGFPRKHIDEPAPINWMNFTGKEIRSPVYQVHNVKPNDVLNMRSGNGSSFPIVAKLPHDGTGIELLDKGCATAWCRIRYQGKEGWVNTAFLKIDLSASEDTEPRPEVSSAANLSPAGPRQERREVANGSFSPYRIHARPDARSAVVGNIPADASTIELLSACDIPREWCQVRLGKTEGWVVGLVHEGVAGRARNISASELKMHVEPREIGTVLGTIPRGAAGIVIMTNCQPDWCTVRYGKKSGWSKRQALEIDWSGAPSVSIFIWQQFEKPIEDKTTGDDMVRLCATPEYAERCTARVYFESMRMTLLAHARQKTICASPVTSATDRDALQRVSKWLAGKPEYLTRQASEGIVAALRAEFPCP
jgi:uncharacterized protein YraI